MRAMIDPSQVAVVVLNWQRADDTIACLESLHTLNPAPGAIHVIDNASTDNSAEEIKGSFPDIEISINKTNKGFGGGQNAAIQTLMDKGFLWIWLLNNDARTRHDTLIKLLEMASSSDNIALVGASIHDTNEPRNIQSIGGGKIHWWLGRSKHVIYSNERIDYITGACMLIKSRAMRKVGLFDESYFMYWEDADLSLRIKHAGYKIMVAEDAIVYHKLSGTLDTDSSRKDFLINASGVRFFRRHGPLGGWPAIILGVIFRTLKRLIRGDSSRAYAVLSGAYQGLRNTKVMRND